EPGPPRLPSAVGGGAGARVADPGPCRHGATALSAGDIRARREPLPPAQHAAPAGAAAGGGGADRRRRAGSLSGGAVRLSRVGLRLGAVVHGAAGRAVREAPSPRPPLQEVAARAHDGAAVLLRLRPRRVERRALREGDGGGPADLRLGLPALGREVPGHGDDARLAHDRDVMATTPRAPAGPREERLAACPPAARM